MNWENKKTPLVITHRGAAGEAPENTLASFQLALEQKCDMMELDIEITMDEQFIICHDDSVNRTTDGAGLIREMTVQQLKGLDAGSWFDPAFTGERLPLLEEVFELVPPSIGR